MRRRRWFGWLIKASAAGSALVFALVAATNLYVLDRGSGAKAVASAPTSDVALVPGCYASGLRPGATLRARLSAALGLYRAGRVRRILVTGNGQETNAMRYWLIAHGAPASDIIVDDFGTRTIESARRAAEVFSVRSAIICTQKLGLARALFLAERAGIDAVGVEAAFDLSDSWRWQAIEALKRTVAFSEVVLLGRLDKQPQPPAIAENERGE